MMGFGMFGGGMLLVWGALIVLVVFVVRGSASSHRTDETKLPQSARQILDERYARGEISQEQYFSMLKDIQE
jgi:putative membrane protein